MITSKQYVASVHILLTIISVPDTRVTNEKLASDTNLSYEQIRKIIRKLKASNILSFKNGTGKISLARPASEITLWNIYNSIEAENIEEQQKFTNEISHSILGENEKKVLNKNFLETINILKEKLSSRTLQDIKEEIDIKNNQIAF